MELADHEAEIRASVAAHQDRRSCLRRRRGRGPGRADRRGNRQADRRPARAARRGRGARPDPRARSVARIRSVPWARGVPWARSVPWRQVRSLGQVRDPGAKVRSLGQVRSPGVEVRADRRVRTARVSGLPGTPWVSGISRGIRDIRGIRATRGPAPPPGYDGPPPVKPGRCRTAERGDHGHRLGVDTRRPGHGDRVARRPSCCAGGHGPARLGRHRRHQHCLRPAPLTAPGPLPPERRPWRESRRPERLGSLVRPDGAQQAVVAALPQRPDLREACRPESVDVGGEQRRFRAVMAGLHLTALAFGDVIS